MKGVKLKPLFLKENDILVGPPEILYPNTSIKGTTKLEDLPALIRGHKLKKITRIKKSDDIEQVHVLSNFRAKSSEPRANIRRFTFRRIGTIRRNDTSLDNKKFSNVVAQSKKAVQEQSDGFSILIKNLLTNDKSVRKEISAQAKSISDTNRQFQEFQQEKFAYLKTELTGYVNNIEKVKEKLVAVETKIEDARKAYDKDYIDLNAQEAKQVHLLLSLIHI